MKFILFRDEAREFRWKLVARNGRSIAVSGEGYKRRGGAIKAIRLLNGYAARAPIHDETAA